MVNCIIQCFLIPLREAEAIFRYSQTWWLRIQPVMLHSYCSNNLKKYIFHLANFECLPARIHSSSDPWLLDSCSMLQLTTLSAQHCQQSTCRWSEFCPSHTGARSYRQKKSSYYESKKIIIIGVGETQNQSHSHCSFNGTNFIGHAETIVAQGSKANCCASCQNHSAHTINWEHRHN